MRGKILNFDFRLSEGIIITDDDERYTFKSTEWKSSDTYPAKNIKVDFVIEGMHAISIYALPEAKYTSDTTVAKFIYIGYLAGLLIPFVPIACVIIAYVYKKDEPSWTETHFKFQIRTFWMSLLYFLISFVLLSVLIGYLTLIIAIVWYIIRCVKGLQALNNQQPIQNVTRWGF